MWGNTLKYLSRGFNFVLLILIFFFTAGFFFGLPEKYYNEILLPSAVLIAAAILFLIIRRLVRLFSQPRSAYTVLKQTSSILLHLPVLFILAAWFLSSFYSVRTYQEAAQGAQLRLAQFETPLDIRVGAIMAETYDDGSPRQYATQIEITGGGSDKSAVVSVNHPVTYGPVKIYQYGYTKNDAGDILTGLLIKSDPGVVWLYAGGVAVLCAAAAKLAVMAFIGRKAEA